MIDAMRHHSAVKPIVLNVLHRLYATERTLFLALPSCNSEALVGSDGAVRVLAHRRVISRRACLAPMQEYVMKTKLMLATCAALFLSSAAMAAQSDNRDGNDHRPSSSVGHDRGNHEGWYKKGGVMPSEYRGNQYVVSDWHSQNLRQPPHGYHWVRSDNGDFLLVAVTTGVISSILLQH
jgi:Ni/Co efflux regulator RcnB